MMDQLIITLVLINIFTNVNGELHCFTCSDCPNSDELDNNMSQPCDLVSPPNTPPSSPPNTPPTSPPNTPPTSPINTPPTGTPTTTAVTNTNVTDLRHMSLGIENNSTSSPVYENEKTTEKPSIILTRSQRILTKTLLYEDIVTQSNHQCFRIIRRNVDDDLEVVRGCVETARTIHETCVRANNGISPITCRICHFDDCNAAIRDKTSSIIIMFTSIISMTILR